MKIRYLALVSLVMLALFSQLGAQERSSSERFRLEGLFVPASGRAASKSFLLTGCLCEGVGGFSVSESFRVLAGCAAFIPAGANLRPGPDPYPRPIADPEPTAPSSAPGAVSERLPAEKK